MLPFPFHGAQQGFEREPAADEQEEKPDVRRASGGGAGREGVGLAGRSLIGQIPPSAPCLTDPSCKYKIVLLP